MNVKREAFADEASWLEFQRNQAELARREHVKQSLRPHRAYRWGAPGGRSWQVIQTAKVREACKRWYWKDAHASRVRNREKQRRLYAANPEKYRMKGRANYHRHAEENRMRARVYRRDHHEERIRYERQYYRDHATELLAARRDRYRAHHEQALQRNRTYKAKHRDALLSYNRESYIAKRGDQYMSRVDRLAKAREFELQILALRAEGWKWTEVEELTGRPWKSCEKAYRRAMKRQQQRKGEQ